MWSNPDFRVLYKTLGGVSFSRFSHTVCLPVVWPPPPGCTGCISGKLRCGGEKSWHWLLNIILSTVRGRDAKASWLLSWHLGEAEGDVKARDMSYLPSPLSSLGSLCEVKYHQSIHPSELYKPSNYQCVKIPQNNAKHYYMWLLFEENANRKVKP